MKKFIIALFGLAAMCAQANDIDYTKPADVQLKNSQDSASYALGYTDGFGIKENFSRMPNAGSSIDKNLVIAGYISGLTGNNGNVNMTSDEAMKILQAYFKQLQKEDSIRIEAEYQKAKAANDKFMANKAKEKGYSKVQSDKINTEYVLLKETKKGDGTKLSDNDFILVDYTGMLKDGTVFDQSKPESPAVFPVMGVIPGMQTALKQLSVGSEAEMIIPSDLAYGKRDVANGKIPANSILDFKIKVIKKFKDQNEAMEYAKAQREKSQQSK